MSEDLMLERLRRMDHKFDGLIEDMRGIRLDVQEIKTRIALIERGYANDARNSNETDDPKLSARSPPLPLHCDPPRYFRSNRKCN